MKSILIDLVYGLTDAWNNERGVIIFLVFCILLNVVFYHLGWTGGNEGSYGGSPLPGF